MQNATDLILQFHHGHRCIVHCGHPASSSCITQAAVMGRRPTPSQPKSNASLHKMAQPAVGTDIVTVISQRGVWTGREAVSLSACKWRRSCHTSETPEETCRWNFHGPLPAGCECTGHTDVPIMGRQSSGRKMRVCGFLKTHFSFYEMENVIKGMCLACSTARTSLIRWERNVTWSYQEIKIDTVSFLIHITGFSFI